MAKAAAAAAVAGPSNSSRKKNTAAPLANWTGSGHGISAALRTALANLLKKPTSATTSNTHSTNATRIECEHMKANKNVNNQS